MVGELIKEYLVGLGVEIDKPGFKEMESTINQTSGTISSATSGWSKNFVTASGIIATALASVTASVVGLMTTVAKQDLAMEKYARQMLVSKDAAMEMKQAVDALGESVLDIQLTPELYNRYKALVSDGRSMKVGGDYEGTMKNFRDLIFEFTRMKQEASYAMQWVGYYLMKYLSRPLEDAKKSFRNLNDSLIKNMPVWTEKIARALVYIINVGRHFWDLLKSIGKTIYAVWDAFPSGIKIATAALAAFFVMLRSSPLGRMIALVSSLLLLVDDYFGYMEGKQAAMGALWDKLNSYIDTGKRKFTEWGKALAPVWDKFVEYLVLAKDGAVELSEKISDWTNEVQNSKGLQDFVDTVKRLGKALQNLGGGIIDFVVESCKDLMDSMEKNDSAKSFTDLMETLWRIFLELIDAISYGCEVLGDWLQEVAKSEIVRDFVDAIVELFDVLRDVIGALIEFYEVALKEFFAGIGKTQPVYSFRDAVKAVVGIITAMIRGVSKLIQWLTDLFKMMSDNTVFKTFWKGLGEVAGVFFDITMKALGAVGRLGQALMALVRGDYKIAARLAADTVDALFGNSKAEAGGRFDFSGSEPTGILSKNYEGDVGTISPGIKDPGGISYGAYQFSSAKGVVDDFVEWLQNQGHRFGDILANAGAVNSSGFKGAWKDIANKSYDEFYKLQHEYIKLTHYNPALKAIKIRSGVDISKMSKTMQEVLWSTAVHQGPGSNIPNDQGNGNGGAARVFERAFNELGINAHDEDLIKKIYELRKEYYPGNEGVYNRLTNGENLDALEMLNQEREYKVKKQEKQEKETPQYEFRNPPAGMRDPTWRDYAKEWALNGVEELGNHIIDAGGWLWDKAGELGDAILGISNNSSANLSAHMQNAVAALDPVIVNRLMDGTTSAYSQSYGGADIKNISYQIEVGDVIVSKTDASAQEIGQAVADKMLTRLQRDVEQAALNRTFGPA